MGMTNLILTADLDCTFDLAALARVLCNVEYNRWKFNALIWRHRRVRGTILLFSSGRITILNCDSLQEGKSGLRKFARILQQRHNCAVTTVKNVRIVTASMHFSLGAKIDLRTLTRLFPNCQYEPELCNSASIRHGKIHIAVHSTGSVLITGVKSCEALDTVIQPILLKLLSYSKTDDGEN